MTEKKAKAKSESKENEFKDIVISHFRQYVKSPVVFLAERAGITRAHMYNIFSYEKNGIGSGKGQLDPRTAWFLIIQADEVIDKDSDAIFVPTPVEEYLRPLLSKFYEENCSNDK